MTLSIGSGNDLNSKPRLCTFSDTLGICTTGCWSIAKQESENLCGFGFLDVGSQEHLKVEMDFAGVGWMYEGYFDSMQLTGFVNKNDEDGERSDLEMEEAMFVWFLRKCIED